MLWILFFDCRLWPSKQTPSTVVPLRAGTSMEEADGLALRLSRLSISMLLHNREGVVVRERLVKGTTVSTMLLSPSHSTIERLVYQGQYFDAPVKLYSDDVRLTCCFVAFTSKITGNPLFLLLGSSIASARTCAAVFVEELSTVTWV